MFFSTHNASVTAALLAFAVVACTPDAATAPSVRQLPSDAAANLVMNPTAWDLTLLPLLPGGTWSEAHAVNDSGVVVGFGDVADGSTHAFKYRDGVITDIGTSKSYSATYARGINLAGEVVGSAIEPGRGPNYPVAVRWSSNGVVAALPGTIAAIASEAYDINSLGVAVGRARVRSPYWHATKWKAGAMIDMDVLAKASETSDAITPMLIGGNFLSHSAAMAINDTEASVGYRWYGNAERPAAWEATNKERWFPILGDKGRATAINANGQTAGWMDYPIAPFSTYWVASSPSGGGSEYWGWPGLDSWPEHHAKVGFSDRERIAGTLTSGGLGQAWTGRYRADDMTLLHSVPPYAISKAVDVNTCGWVVGYVAKPHGGPRRAALWRGFRIIRSGKTYVCDPPV